MKSIHHQNFSLVELLLVIGILMILVSMIQPSLKSLLLKGDSIQCLNNQRQLYQGYLLYGEENADKIVPSIQITYRAGSSDWRQADRLVTWDEAIINYFRQDPIPTDFIENVRFHQYKQKHETQGVSVFSCPRHSQITKELHAYVQRDWSFQRSYSSIGISYKNTTHVNHDHYYLKNGPAGTNWSMTFSELPDPGNTFLIGEHFHGHNMIGYLALQNQRGPVSMSNYHKNIESPHGNMSFNFLYTDGHAQNHYLFEFGQTLNDRHGPWTMQTND